jgi:hypothetical protein
MSAAVHRTGGVGHALETPPRGRWARCGSAARVRHLTAFHSGEYSTRFVVSAPSPSRISPRPGKLRPSRYFLNTIILCAMILAAQLCSARLPYAFARFEFQGATFFRARPGPAHGHARRSSSRTTGR